MEGRVERPGGDLQAQFLSCGRPRPYLAGVTTSKQYWRSMVSLGWDLTEHRRRSRTAVIMGCGCGWGFVCQRDGGVGRTGAALQPNLVARTVNELPSDELEVAPAL